MVGGRGKIASEGSVSPLDPAVVPLPRRLRARARHAAERLAAEIEDIWNSWPEPSRRWWSSGSAPAVADDAAGLAQAQPRRREVVWRVVEDLAAADPLELSPHPWDLVDHPRADLDHRVELAGDDPGHRERLRAELERPAADRGAVDQVAQHLDRLPAPAGPGTRRPRTSVPRRRLGSAQPGASSAPPSPRTATEPVSGLDLDHAPNPHVGHRRLAVAAAAPARRPRTPTRARPSPAACRRSGRRPARGCHRARPPVPGPRSRTPSAARARRRTRPEARSALASTANVTSPPAPSPANAAPGVRAQHGQHPLAQAQRQLEYQLAIPRSNIRCVRHELHFEHEMIGR